MPMAYAAELRRRAVALARSGRPIEQLSADLQASEATLFHSNHSHSDSADSRGSRSPCKLTELRTSVRERH
jgi:hypothetical protein